MSDDFAYYLTKQARTEAARANRNHASVALDNAEIHERLARIKSQHEPLAGLIEAPMSERDRLYAAAFYVVVGRMPS